MRNRRWIVHAFNIWMNETLRYMYATLPNIRLKLNITPMGTIALLKRS